MPSVAHDAAVPAKAQRPVYFRGGWQPTPIYDHAAMGAGSVVAGPAVIEASDTTILVNPEQTARMDGFGNLVMDVSIPNQSSNRQVAH